ncbi:MAG: DNA polymerase III subunit alpha [Chlorobiaceae bacterium]|nr:DNA polymerase III subunit alpha [Chlorobiaceae bacterium]
MEFVHLHTHTHYSMQSSPIFPGELFAACRKHGMTTVAVTDYSAMFNMPELFGLAKKAEVKLIMGSEIYIAGTDSRENGRPATLVLLIRDEVGYRNMCILLSRAAREGFHNGTPQVERKTLESCSEGLVCLSAAHSGLIGRALMAGDDATAEKWADAYRSLFGDNFYLELQRHGVPYDDHLVDSTIRLSDRLSIPLVATNNVHYLEKKDSGCYRAMIANRTKERLNNKNLQCLPGNENYFKSAGEMAALFDNVRGELDNTVRIAQGCSYAFTTQEPRLPVFPLPEGFADEKSYLRHLTWEGAREKYADAESIGIDPQEVKDRIEMELGVIEKMGFSSYFLIVSDLIAASRRMGYSVGPGRGSAAGSIIAYLTGITRIDPIMHKLLFERFLNPERLSMPDIDIDFTPVGKQKVLDYTVEKYGTASVAKVIAIGTLGAKAAIRDAGRVLDVPLKAVDQLAKLVPSRPGTTLEDAFRDVKELKRLADSDPQYQQLMQYARAMEGRARNVSMHAGAVVITNGVLEEQVPLYISNKIETEERKYADEFDASDIDGTSGKSSDGADEKQVVTQFDKNCIEQAGLLKIDYLGLETLAVIDETLRMIKKRHGVDIELEKLPLNDRQTFRIFQEGKMAGIFQFESSGMQSYMTRLQPTQIGDIIAMSALYRPGALNAEIDEDRNAVDLFVDRKHGREEIDYMHPMLEGILKETYGVIVYQEQVMQISQVMGRFSLAKADNLRKAMGKKDPKLMQKFRDEFVEGAVTIGVNQVLATRIFDLMAEFAGYGFNKSHSAAYGVLAYWTGYLKAHYTIEFVTAVLNSEIGDTERMKHLTDEAKGFGIFTLPPSINRSDALFSVDEHKGRSCIRVGLSAIKQVGAGARAVVAAKLRRNGKPFVNLFDLTVSVDLRAMNRKALESLIQAGALDEIDNNRARLLANVDKAIKFGQMQNKAVTLGQGGFFNDDSNDGQIGVHYPELDNAEPMPDSERLQHEKRLVGFYLSHHPLDRFRRDWEAFANLPLDTREVVKSRLYKAIGVIVSVKPYQDKKGKQMLFGVIEDFTGKADFTVFASVYEQFRHHLRPDEVVMLAAEADVKDSSLKLLVREVVPMKKVRDGLVRKVVLKIDADDPSQVEKLKEVRQIFEQHKGGTPVDFEVRAMVSSCSETVKIFARNTPIEPDDETLEKLEEVLGPDNVKITG